MKSMTAYSVAEEKTKYGRVKIALRSLNYKYLDISVYNLPQQALVLEEKMREEIKKNINRGKVEVYFYQQSKHSSRLKINQKQFAGYIKQIKLLAGKFNLSKEIPPMAVLNLPGVMSASGRSDISRASVLSALKKALQRLISFKKEKGRAIKKELLKNLGRLRKNITAIKNNKKPPAEESDGKEDIDEEVSLIKFYLKKLKTTINSKKQLRKGKTIDFLSQEILRELNAASSKTKKEKLAGLIIEAKNYLGRIREQAQNVE